MKKIFFIVFIFFVGTSQQVIQAQTVTKAQKTAEKKKEEQKKKSAIAERKGKEKHVKLQSKDVQKRMKRNRKRFHHVDSFDNRPNFWQRIFPRKKPSAY